MAPDTVQRAAFEEDSRPYAWPVMHGGALDIENHTGGFLGHTLRWVQFYHCRAHKLTASELFQCFACLFELENFHI